MAAPPPRAPVSDIPRPYARQYRGSALARRLLALFGWRVLFEGMPTGQGVAIIYPHTSNWDFVIMIAAKWASGVPANFWSKQSMFRVPLFGRWLRWVGGVPVDRDSPRGQVGQAIDLMRARRAAGADCWLGITPEGTRRRAPGWRSGFYRTALQAGVPVSLIRLDYARREVAIVDFFVLCGDEATDMARIAAACQGVVGAIPGNASPVRLLPPRTGRSGAGDNIAP